MSLGTSFAFICSWFLQCIEDVIFGRLFWTRLVLLHFLDFLEWIVANSHHVVEHPFEISIHHCNPLIFAVMPFLGKGEWPLEFELVEQSSSTLTWYIQIGHVGLHHNKICICRLMQNLDYHQYVYFKSSLLYDWCMFIEFFPLINISIQVDNFNP